MSNGPRHESLMSEVWNNWNKKLGGNVKKGNCPPKFSIIWLSKLGVFKVECQNLAPSPATSKGQLTKQRANMRSIKHKNKKKEEMEEEICKHEASTLTSWGSTRNYNKYDTSWQWPSIKYFLLCNAGKCNARDTLHRYGTCFPWAIFRRNASILQHMIMMRIQCLLYQQQIFKRWHCIYYLQSFEQVFTEPKE